MYFQILLEEQFLFIFFFPSAHNDMILLFTLNAFCIDFNYTSRGVLNFIKSETRKQKKNTFLGKRERRIGGPL